MNKILVLIPVDDSHRNIIEGAAPNARFIYKKRSELTEGEMEDVSIIIGNPPMDKLEYVKDLLLVQLSSAGVGDYANPGVLPENTILANASGAYGLAISEYMTGAVLMILKKFYLYRDNQLEGKWQDEGEVMSIHNSTALILGAGDIGGEFAKRMKLLGAHTIGIRRTNTSKSEYLDEVKLMDSLDEVLPRADIIGMSLPSTPLTKNIMNRQRLMSLKKNAVLVNVGRGDAIDTQALCDVLESGRIAGAALDVFDPEPLPEDHRLWKIKNAFITPHVSGGFSLKETYERILRISAHNIGAVLEGKTPMSVVDKKAGY